MRQAIKCGNLDDVKKLLQEDPEKLNLELSVGSWLNVAVRENRPEIVTYLLEAGIDRSIVASYTNKNAISDAAAAGTPEMIEYLIDNGINVILETDESNPVFAAITGNNLTTLEYLLDYEKSKMESSKYLELCEKVKQEAELLQNEKILVLVSGRGLKKKEIARIDHDQLICSIIPSISSILEPIKKVYDGETIYALSLEVDRENYSFWFYVNTEENYSKCLEEAADDQWYYRFCESEWYVYEDTKTYFGKATQYLNGLKGDIDISEVYECIVEAFSRLRKEGVFERVFGRFVFMTINATESFDEETMIKFVKKINGKENCKDYIENIESFY